MVQETVVVGMSGGVDSSVSAFLLKKEGYKVIGAFLKCFSDTKNNLTGECAWVEERKMAQKIAVILGIQFVTLDFESDYKNKVIEPMFKSYKKGLTPNPDIWCNTFIKFPFLWREAKKLGADFIATGHYACRKKTNKGYELFAGKDEEKDQSYFLAELTMDDLSHTLFPIGKLTKEKVREIAKKNNFPNWKKPGTRGICFVGNIFFQDFLKQRIAEKKGRVVDPNGNKIGIHMGSMYYTIGQRIGESIGIDIEKPIEFAQKRWYVAVKKRGNLIIAAPEGHSLLAKSRVFIRNFYVINSDERIPESGLRARIRHLGELHSGRAVCRRGQWSFVFAKPVQAIAEGQYIVIYKGDKVIGGGEIRI